MILRLISDSRGFSALAGAVLILTLPCVLLSGRGLAISVAQPNPENILSIPELCGVLSISLAISITRPRLWSIDRLGKRNRRWIPSTLSAYLVIAAPQVLLAAGLLANLPFELYENAAANMLFLASGGVALATVIGAFGAAGTVLVSYFAAGSALQMEPRLWPWFPVVSSAAERAHWLPAVLMCAVALGTVILTTGRARWLQGRD